MKRIVRSAIVECDAMSFYLLVEAIESYPKFLPWCAAAEMHESAPGRSVATLALAVKGLRYSLTTENTHLPGQAIDMRLVQGPFKHFAAAWRFTSLGANACKAEYSMEYEFSTGIVAAALEPVFRRIADSTVEAFTRRAMASQGSARIAPHAR
jgi:ribosome-associated toxin RatA of RatAB toxin-antitoxin module